MKLNIKQPLAFALAFMMSISSVAFADEILGDDAIVGTKVGIDGKGSSIVKVEQEATNFDVVIPLQLLFNMDKYGVVTTPTEAHILNKSFGPIQVKDIKLDKKIWNIVDFNANKSIMKVDSKQIGFRMYDNENKDTFTETTPTFGFATNDNWIIRGIDKTNTYGDKRLVYDGIMSPTSDNVSQENAIDTIFTIDWYEAEIKEDIGLDQDNQVVDLDNWQYSLNSNSKTATLNKYLGNYNDGQIEGKIPATILRYNPSKDSQQQAPKKMMLKSSASDDTYKAYDKYNVIELGNLFNNDFNQNISIPDGVSSINETFKDCDNLKDKMILIPDTLTSISEKDMPSNATSQGVKLLYSEDNTNIGSIANNNNWLADTYYKIDGVPSIPQIISRTSTYQTGDTYQQQYMTSSYEAKAGKIQITIKSYKKGITTVIIDTKKDITLNYAIYSPSYQSSGNYITNVSYNGNKLIDANGNINKNIGLDVVSSSRSSSATVDSGKTYIEFYQDTWYTPINF